MRERENGEGPRMGKGEREGVAGEEECGRERRGWERQSEGK